MLASSLPSAEGLESKCLFLTGNTSRAELKHVTESLDGRWTINRWALPDSSNQEITWWPFVLDKSATLNGADDGDGDANLNARVVIKSALLGAATGDQIRLNAPMGAAGSGGLDACYVGQSRQDGERLQEPETGAVRR